MLLAKVSVEVAHHGLIFELYLRTYSRVILAGASASSYFALGSCSSFFSMQTSIDQIQKLLDHPAIDQPKYHAACFNFRQLRTRATVGRPSTKVMGAGNGSSLKASNDSGDGPRGRHDLRLRVAGVGLAGGAGALLPFQQITGRILLVQR